MKVLVTGGCGYIGSHTILELVNFGFDVVAIDNLSNSSVLSLERVESISNKSVNFIEADIMSFESLVSLFREHSFDAVIHFAALKAVGESIEKPLDYYKNNISGTLNLLNVMKMSNVKNFIFSSSATVYGEYAKVPYKEHMSLGSPSSPYGFSKVVIERMMLDISATDKEFRGISLRYFNPIGAHESGIIGEDPHGIPNNLLPFINQVAIGKREKLNIFGNDYNTKDGTCERDYLHVVDLASGHLNALEWLLSNNSFHGVEAFNLGTGCAVSVLEIVKTFEAVNNIKINYDFKERRPGDLSAFWADSSKAKEVLGWSAKYDLKKMLEDSWNWQVKNPNGYS